MDKLLEYLSPTVLPTIFAIIAWAFRLEGKVRVLEQQHVSLKELTKAKFDAVEKKTDWMNTIIEACPLRHGSAFKEKP